MNIILTSVLLVLLAAPAFAQVTCFNYAGGMVSCVGPHGSTRTLVPFSGSGGRSGIMTDERGRMEPYNILPSQPSRPPGSAITP